MDYDYLSASNGSGDAALMHITADRLTGSATLQVDSVVNVSAKFIAVAGDALPSGFIDPATKTEFTGHLSDGDLIIDDYEPGSSDVGNTSGQIVVVKPATGWANRVAQFIKNATGFGTPEAVTFGALDAGAVTADSISTSGDAAITGNETVGGSISITGTSHIIEQTVATSDGSNNITPTSQQFSVTALAHAATVVVPSYTPADGMSGVLKILDNGTARALTWPTGWVPIGVTLPTSTVAGKWLYVSYTYNGTDSKYHVVGIARQS